MKNHSPWLLTPSLASEYSQTFPLTQLKRKLKEAGFPLPLVENFVDDHYSPTKFSSTFAPHSNNIVFLEAPSTSRLNTIPLLLAQRLQSDFGGDLVLGKNYATPLASSEAKAKNSYIAKMEDPSSFLITDPDLSTKLQHKFVVLVDDFLTSGETLDGWIEALACHGVSAHAIAVIGALHGALPTTHQQLNSLARKLGNMTKEHPKRIFEDLLLAHGHSRSTLIKKADEDATLHPQTVRMLIARKADFVRGLMAGREIGSPLLGSLVSPSSPRGSNILPLQALECPRKRQRVSDPTRSESKLLPQTGSSLTDSLPKNISVPDCSLHSRSRSPSKKFRI